MRRWLLGFLLAIVATLALGQGHSGAADAGYFGGRTDGWFWYQDPVPPVKDESARQNAPPPSERKALLARFDQYKHNLEEARIRAFLDPTPEAFTRWATLQTELVQRVSAAADIWQRTVWANPQFDFTQERPVNQVALNAYQQNKASERRAVMDRLANSAILFFFFRGDCPHCHAFAPSLAGLSRATGLRVFAVSLDGGSLPDFPSPRPDNGISQTLQVRTVPALFLAEPGAGRITPISYGVLSIDELTERLIAIANPPAPAIGAATPTQPMPLEATP